MRDLEMLGDDPVETERLARSAAAHNERAGNRRLLSVTLGSLGDVRAARDVASERASCSPRSGRSGSPSRRCGCGSCAPSRAAADPALIDSVHDALDAIERRASHIGDPARRAGFLERVEENAALRQIARELGVRDEPA